MSESMNQQILLKRYPTVAPQESDFALVETAIPEPGDGEVLNRTVYLSLDPYMRGRMSDSPKEEAAPTRVLCSSGRIRQGHDG